MAKSVVRSSVPVTKAAVRQMIRSSIANNTELKISQGGTNGNTSTSGAIAGITDIISQGDTVGLRTGDKILIKSMTIKYSATINTAATSDRVRFMVFADTENLNTTPAVIDVLATANVNSFPNIGYEAAGRFKIFYDQTHQLNTAGGAGIFRTATVPIKNWPVYYSTTTGVGKNNLFFLEISDTGTNVATFSFTSEVRYTDA